MAEKRKLDPIHKPSEFNPSAFLLWIIGLPTFCFGIYMFLTGIFNFFSGDNAKMFGEEGLIAIILSLVFIILGIVLMPSPYRKAGCHCKKCCGNVTEDGYFKGHPRPDWSDSGSANKITIYDRHGNEMGYYKK